MTTPWLTDAEVDDLCDPLVQPAAQIRYLRAEGLTVGVKPNGRARVMRSNVEEVFGGLPAAKGKRSSSAPRTRPACQPDAAGLVLVYNRKG